jgi:hypothetical protein
MPEPPGPPGATNSTPIRFCGSVAGSRPIAMFVLGPLGLFQSIGTSTVEHSPCRSPHGSQVRSAGSASAVCAPAREDSTSTADAATKIGA